MNTLVVWVMMAYTGHGWVPTLEFKTQSKCEIAATKIKTASESQGAWGYRMSTPYCVEIEK